MKTCTICKTPKELEEFNKNKKKKDGYNTICRVCSNNKSREYYKQNPDNHKKNVSARNKSNRSLLQLFVLDYFKSHSCVDCGNSDIRVLEFDHLPEFEKTADVSRLMACSYSLDRIKEEINKCEVVCANCHKIRTVERSICNYRK